MTTTTTIDTNEGWTFADDNNPAPEFTTTTEPNNNWGIPPAAPSPPLSAVEQPRANDHASLHWTACYDDYCGAHRQMKDNNYYPRRGNDRRRRNHQQCDCPNVTHTSWPRRRTGPTLPVEQHGVVKAGS